MNENQTIPQPEPTASAGQEQQGQTSELKKPKGQTRNGKVARLRKDDRDRINEMMRDGLTYKQIIEAMGEVARGLDESHLATWKSGGYTEWLAARERREDQVAIQEAIIDRVLKVGAPDLRKAAIQIAVTKAFQLMDGLAQEAMQKGMDANNFTRLLNAVAKLADGELKSESHEQDTADREAKLQRENAAPKRRGLSAEGLKEIEENRFNPPDEGLQEEPGESRVNTSNHE